MLQYTKHFKPNPDFESEDALLTALSGAIQKMGDYFSHLAVSWHLTEEAGNTLYGLTVDVKAVQPMPLEEVKPTPTDFTARFSRVFELGRIPYVVDEDVDTFLELRENGKMYQKLLKQHFPDVRRDMGQY